MDMECSRLAKYIHLSPEQQVFANTLINQLKENPSIFKKQKLNNNIGKISPHWTAKLEHIWFERIDNNAKCMKPLKDIYSHDSKWLYKLKHLNNLYGPILSRLKKIEDISYSRHYILQLHISHIFDEISITNECVKHTDIEEYKNIDIEMEECFCNSFKDTYPIHCLYCRG